MPRLPFGIVAYAFALFFFKTTYPETVVYLQSVIALVLKVE